MDFKVLAGVVIAIGIVRASVLAVATIMGVGTAIERVDSSTDAIVFLVLGAILWQISTLKENK